MYQEKSGRKKLKAGQFLLFFCIVLPTIFIFFWPIGVVEVVCRRANFSVMPEDDALFRYWLASQPGVSRIDLIRDGTKLIIYYNQFHKNQSLISSLLSFGRQVPDLETQATAMGYKPLSKFEKCTSRGWQDDPFFP
jgi:hypothetical protein